MRQAYAAPLDRREAAVPVQPSPQGPYVSDINKRLQALLGTQRSPAGVLPPQSAAPGTNSSSHNGYSGFTPVGQQQQQQYVPVAQQQPQGSLQPPLQQAPASLPRVEDDEELLLPAEVECLRSVELDAKVSVLADLRKDAEASPPQLTLLCDDATVKIFPQLVVLSHPSGAPLVEMVISELHELTEDDSRGSLAFVLKKFDGATTVVEVQCSSATARSALYKLVCSKRNMLDARK